MTFEEIAKNIKSLPKDDLIKLNGLVVDQIKTARKSDGNLIKATLKVGQEVNVTESNGKVSKGTLIKKNRTRARVKINGVSFAVPFSMISAA